MIAGSGKLLVQRPRRGLAGGALVAALLGLSACAPKADPVAKLPPELAVPAAATKVTPRGDGVVSAVEYRLPAPYPAEEFLADLEARLGARGWKPMERDFLNPEIPTSKMRGWTAFVDPASRPPRGVHRWQGEWTNEKGDVVDYNLEYAVPANFVDQPPPPEAELEVTAFLHAADRAREMAAAAARAKKKS